MYISRDSYIVMLEIILNISYKIQAILLYVVGYHIYVTRPWNLSQ